MFCCSYSFLICVAKVGVITSIWKLNDLINRSSKNVFDVVAQISEFCALSMQAIQAFYGQISVPQKVVITTHQKPDGDAMGSSLALYHFLTQFGHSVTVISPTNWASFLKWMPDCNKVIDFE